MAIEYRGHLAALREAFRSGRLTLYLGAGVSTLNGLPSWKDFVQALYFTTLSDESYINNLRPFPNYLFALAEWVLEQKDEPLEIIVRKIKQWYEGKDFIGMMTDTLYAGLARETFGDIKSLSEFILAQNATLRAILDCSAKSVPGVSGLRSIITYNYDNLVEIGLESYGSAKDNFQVIYRHNQRLLPNKVPIYHVHGYIPHESKDVAYDDIIFSEDQYNRVFQDPSFWGNLVQVNQLTSATGLMIGMSLSDRNTRRILDSIRSQPLPRENFILMRKPQFPMINDPSPELNLIRQKAEAYLARFPRSALKMPGKEPWQIQQLLDRIYQYENNEFEKGFENLDLHLITVDSYAEIPLVMQQITEE
jgi:hypothetical protein